jgi:hypothetical protein
LKNALTTFQRISERITPDLQRINIPPCIYGQAFFALTHLANSKKRFSGKRFITIAIGMPKNLTSEYKIRINK